jgi:osmotically-inducible protein OsmY
MSDDKKLKQDVLAELSWEPSVDSAHVGVTTHDGVVTLTGHVGSYVEKHAAETAASRVKGVKAVAEEIEVKLPLEVKRGDEEIAAAAADRLAWDVAIPSDSVKVKVENGWVTLSGELEWHYQLDAVERNVRGLYGVVGVYNQITIKPVANATNINDNIMHALNRSWFDPKKISVTAEGGKITLTGKVSSWADRELAGETAWAAPGAVTVKNGISIAW